MSKDSIQEKAQSWTFVLPVGVLTLLGALMLSISNEAAISLELARQHGESILLLREQVKLLRGEVKEIRGNRYTDKDAQRDLGYIRRDLEELKQVMKDTNK